MADMADTAPVRPLIKNVAFFGDSDVPVQGEVYRSAFEAAKLLAQEGYTIVNGGGPGVMDASTKGAESVQGETIAVTFHPKDAPGFEGRYLGNVTDTEIVTKNYIERMFKLLEHADMFVIFKGGSGTISEFGTAWVLAKLYFGHHKPFILYGGFWQEVIDALVKNMLLDEKELEVFEIVTSKDELVEKIHSFEKRMREIDHSHCEVCDEKAFMT